MKRIGGDDLQIQESVPTKTAIVGKETFLNLFVVISFQDFQGAFSVVDI
jgi:hypothetical protein